MKITPKENTEDIFRELTPLQQTTRKAAIVFAFVGVFVWTIKILFL
jgi:hypothetical protein